MAGQPGHIVDDATAPSVSADHTLAYRSGTWAMPAEPVLLDRSGRVLGPAGNPCAGIRNPVLSLDGDGKGVLLFRFTPDTSGFDIAPGGQRLVAVRRGRASGNFITVVGNWLLDSLKPHRRRSCPRGVPRA